MQAERELEGCDPNRQEAFNPQHGFVSINFLGVLKSMNIMHDFGWSFCRKKMVILIFRRDLEGVRDRNESGQGYLKTG